MPEVVCMCITRYASRTFMPLLLHYKHFKYRLLCLWCKSRGTNHKYNTNSYYCVKKKNGIYQNAPYKLGPLGILECDFQQGTL